MERVARDVARGWCEAQRGQLHGKNSNNDTGKEEEHGSGERRVVKIADGAIIGEWKLREKNTNPGC